METQQILTRATKIYPYTTERIKQFKNEVDRKFSKDKIGIEEFTVNICGLNFYFHNENAKDDFSTYIDDLIQEFYELINEMIISLNTGNCSIIQQKKMETLLPEMTEYFFNSFSPETRKTGGFAIARATGWELKDKQGVYILAKDFTKDYVSDIIKTLLQNKEKSANKKPNPEQTKQMFKEIGVVLASKEYNEIKKKQSESRKTDEEITKHFFPHLTQETIPKLSTVRIKLNQSYGTTKGFWEYGGQKTEKLVDVLNFVEKHYNENKKEMDVKFQEKMNKIRL